ncbi:copper resistance CopC family protein [Isoptericola luteus]|nr:copper resistance CopC family protein [Isoptericola sp. NEAU-Y5]
MKRASSLAPRVAAGLLGALLAVVAGSVVPAAPAAAHNVVVDTSPPAGRTVTESPTEVSVTFDDVVLDLTGDGTGTVVQVTDADGAPHTTGCPTARDRTVTVPVRIDAPGTYTVAWRIVSADGHPTSGEHTFTFAPADGAPAPEDPSAAPAALGCETGPQDDDGTAAAPAAPTTSGGDLTAVLAIAGGVVLLAGAGVLVALRLSRPRD